MAVVTVNLGPVAVDLAGIRAGDRNEMGMTLTSSGAPIDLTGKVVAAQARLTASASAALSAEVTVTNAAAGKFTMAWPGDEVRAIMGNAEQWRGVWDLQIGDEDETAMTVVAGSFTAVMDVTRAGA